MYLQIHVYIIKSCAPEQNNSFMSSLLLDKKPFTEIRLLNWTPAFQSTFEILCSKTKGNLPLSSDMTH